MRKSIADNIMKTARGLKKSGLMDEITIKNIKALCLPDNSLKKDQRGKNKK